MVAPQCGQATQFFKLADTVPARSASVGLACRRASISDNAAAEMHDGCSYSGIVDATGWECKEISATTRRYLKHAKEGDLRFGSPGQRRAVKSFVFARDSRHPAIALPGTRPMGWGAPWQCLTAQVVTPDCVGLPDF
jgi:hypothetical protein